MVSKKTATYLGKKLSYIPNTYHSEKLILMNKRSKYNKANLWVLQITGEHNCDLGVKKSIIKIELPKAEVKGKVDKFD